MAWPRRLYLVDGDGQMFASPNAGHRLERRGEIGGTPAAFVAEGPDVLYVALHDGTIKRSTDGGHVDDPLVAVTTPLSWRR